MGSIPNRFFFFETAVPTVEVTKSYPISMLDSESQNEPTVILFCRTMTLLLPLKLTEPTHHFEDEVSEECIVQMAFVTFCNETSELNRENDYIER